MWERRLIEWRERMGSKAVVGVEERGVEEGGGARTVVGGSYAQKSSRRCSRGSRGRMRAGQSWRAAWTSGRVWGWRRTELWMCSLRNVSCFEGLEARRGRTW